MHIKRILATILCLTTLFACLPLVGFAENEPVIYLDSANGSDSNSGLTEAEAVATLNGAYTALSNNIGSASRGKIVLVEDYTFVFTSDKGTQRDISTVNHNFEVVLTGKTPETVLQFHLYNQCYIGMKGPTTLENITVRIAEGSASEYLSIHGKGALTIGQGVTTSANPSLRPSLSAAPYFSSSAVKNLTVNSGDWRNVYASGYISTMTGDAILNFNGGTALKIGTNFNGTQNGNAAINVNGGTVENIIAASINASGKVNGDVTVNINGGTVTTEIDPDGIGTLSGTSTVNLTANGVTLSCPGTVNVNNYTGGTLNLGSATNLNITGTVTGTTAVTVNPAIRYNFAYITAPTSTADDAFTFSQANMTVQTDSEKSWLNLDADSGFTGLVLKVPSAQTTKLYPGVSGGSVITPDSTKTVDGYKYQYYANLMGTYRYVTTQSGYYSTTKVVYMSEAESLTETVVDATAAKKAGTGFEPSSVKDYSDEMHVNIPSDESALWWEDYSQYLTTPVFTIDRADHQATTQAEMEAYIAALDNASDNMYVYSMGTSQSKGYNMPIVIFTATDLSGAKTLEEAAALVNANNKVTVHYQAQIHGNEPAAGEAALAQIGRLDTAYGDNLLKNLNIYVIPRVNPDGSYLYQRNSTSGINMNRDMLLAQTQEIQALHRVYSLFSPELAVDSHEYTYQPELASGTYNDMMIASGHNGNSGAAFVEYSEMFARLPFNALYSYNMQPAYYINETNGKYAASGNNYRGMRGSISLLLESRGIGGGNHTYERRVAAHLIAMEQILGYASENCEELQAASDAERNRIITSGMTYEQTDVIVLEHDLLADASLKHTNKTFNNATGIVTSTYTTTPKAYRTAKEGRDRPRPTAYVIPAGYSWTQDVLDLMDIQDISYYFVEAGSTVRLQQYTGTIESAALTDEQNYSFPNGCYVLPMNQPNATILAILMEPDIIDEYNVDAGGSTETVPSGTLAQMNIIPAENNVFPIFRYVQNLNADGTIDAIALPDAPTGLTAVKITTAGGTGAITGLSSEKQYEYRADGSTAYTAVAAGSTEITGLTAGSYYIRYTATSNAPASAEAILTVTYGVLDSYAVYINSSTGADTNNGYSETEPVKTISQAYKQLDSIMESAPAGTSAKLVLLANYDLGASRFVFPAHDYPVIFTAKTPTIALSKGGNASPQESCAIDISGPMTFEHMTLKITSSSQYNNFNARGHKVVMGEGLTCVAGSKGKYFMLAAGGFDSVIYPSTDLTVLSGTWEYIYAGSYTGGVSGDANVTIKNATIKNSVMASYNATTGGNVNYSISHSSIPILYCGNASKNHVGGNVTVTLGQGAYIPTIYAGSRDAGNVGGTVTMILDGADLTGCQLIGKAKNTSGTVGSSALVLKNGTLGKISNFGSVTLNTTGYVKLSEAVATDMTVLGNSYLDLNGKVLTGNLTGTGTLFGMDSSSDTYELPTGAVKGTVSCNVSTHFKSDVTGQVKRYMAIAEDTGYTFHRFYVGITKLSLRTGETGFGYKARFCADTAVQALVDCFGFTLQLDGMDTIVTESLPGSQLDSNKEYSLLLHDFDVKNHGDTAVNAEVFLKLKDNTTITSASCSYSLKNMVEKLNTMFEDLKQTKQEALVAFVTTLADIIKGWEIGNIK